LILLALLTTGVVDANYRRRCFVPVTIYTAFVVDTGKKFTAGVAVFNVNLGKYVTNVVVDTGGKFAAGVSGTGGQFSANVVDRCCTLSCECFRKFREKIEMSLLELLGGQW
jgi:hypothetical protein